MDKLTIDPTLLHRFGELHAPTEVCDESGKTLGHYLPAPLYEELFYSALAAESPHSKEELKLRHRETGGRPLHEILNELAHRST